MRKLPICNRSENAIRIDLLAAELDIARFVVSAQGDAQSLPAVRCGDKAGLLAGFDVSAYPLVGQRYLMARVSNCEAGGASACDPALRRQTTKLIHRAENNRLGRFPDVDLFEA